MDLKQLSNIYFLTTNRMHNSATDLYESLHTPSGHPRVDSDRLHNTIRKYKKDIELEFDMIRAALLEYYDDADLP
mgnify:FL=1|tara:strand:+ start:6739 stop:6963 length:225 start_codon:yes stop_codon:yes gene_type:complete